LLSLSDSSIKKLTKIVYKMNNIERKRSLDVTSFFEKMLNRIGKSAEFDESYRKKFIIERK